MSVADSCSAALPSTGSNISILVGVALGMVLVGLVAVVARRWGARFAGVASAALLIVLTMVVVPERHAFAAGECPTPGALTSPPVPPFVPAFVPIAPDTPEVPSSSQPDEAVQAVSPPPVVPEAPLPVLFGVSGVLVFGAVIVSRRTVRERRLEMC